jgi:hypothetical protein
LLRGVGKGGRSNPLAEKCQTRSDCLQSPAATLLLSALLPKPKPSDALALLVYKPKLLRIALLPLPAPSSSAPPPETGVLGNSGSGVFSFSSVVIALRGSLSREDAREAERGDSALSDVPFSRRREELVGGVEAATGEEAGRGTLLVYSRDVRLA